MAAIAGDKETVYNPFDALLLFHTREFKACWFETGTPKFLVETLVKRGVPSPTLDGIMANETLLSTFDVDCIATEVLLFQTGYLSALLRPADIEGLEQAIHAFFASIPYEWHIRNEIARCEDDYASVSYFAGLGPDSTVEERGSCGRLDMAMRVAGRVYLFEFKLLEQAGPGAAMAQLSDRGYGYRYRSLGEPVHPVAVESSAATRNVAGFEAEVA